MSDDLHRRWMEIYRRRAALDPLRATIDEGDPDNRKNEYVDFVERRRIAAALGRRRFGVALDLGCGAGRLSGLLAGRSGRVVGVDASIDLLRAARRHGPAPNVSFVRGDLRALPVATGAADLAFSCGALLHLVEDADLAAAAREVRRVLAPGGLALLVEHVSAGGATERREGVVFRDPDDFARPFGEAGLPLLERRPVRKVPSRLIHWVRRRRLPRALWPLAARLEPVLATRGREPPLYREVAFLLRG